ncbi:MAG: 3-hydroxyacyl-CoA dehydrogenase NAD-binding domain-containing protein, partial [Candidatus Dormibacterales bacterium]
MTGPPLPSPAGVVGGGRMGAGIAQVLLLAGTDVILVEADPGSAAAAAERVRAGLERAAERAQLDQTVPGVGGPGAAGETRGTG